MKLRVFCFVFVFAGTLAAGACGGGREAEGPTKPEGTPPAPNQSSPAERNPLPPPPPAPPDKASCDATRAQWAVGERASDALLERARVAAGAKTARFVRPDQPITMEYLPSRLTVGLNRTDVVQTVVCG